MELEKLNEKIGPFGSIEELYNAITDYMYKKAVEGWSQEQNEDGELIKVEILSGHSYTAYVRMERQKEKTEKGLV